jgi:hypothetical protein
MIVVVMTVSENHAVHHAAEQQHVEQVASEKVRDREMGSCGVSAVDSPELHPLSLERRSYERLAAVIPLMLQRSGTDVVQEAGREAQRVQHRVSRDGCCSRMESNSSKILLILGESQWP